MNESLNDGYLVKDGEGGLFSPDSLNCDDGKRDESVDSDTRISTLNDMVRPILKIGSRGEDVVKLQSILIELNYLSGIPDGFFGVNTERAVKNFQVDHKLLVDGIVGPSTRATLERALEIPKPATRPTLREGDKNAFVKEVQLRLITLGYFSGDPNGIFESDTTEAVKSFQRSQNLIDDGIVGPNTWRAINRSFSAIEVPIPALRPTIFETSTGEDVILLQTILRVLNYFGGEVNGIFGPDTTKAVEEFQLAMGIPVTGIVDQNTWEKLERSVLLPSNEFRELKEGSTGEDVIILQEELKALKHFSGSVTGSFGPETTEAVKLFQSSLDLIPTGIVDQNTWAILNEQFDKLALETPVTISRPTIRLGATGSAVSELQTLLKQLMFYDGPIDGIFGNSTNIAVRSFQANNNLIADGIVGQRTWSALNYLYSPLAICGAAVANFKGVVIDAGHGGTDPGAVSPEIIEKEYTLKISQYMANRFRELGIPFAMTRNIDETLTPAQRVERMKEPFGDVSNVIVISNHINAGGGEDTNVVNLKDYDIVCVQSIYK